MYIVIFLNVWLWTWHKDKSPLIKQLLQIIDELILAKRSIDEAIAWLENGLGEVMVLGVHMNSSWIRLGIGHRNLYYGNIALFLNIDSFLATFPWQATYLWSPCYIEDVFCARMRMNPCIICSFNGRFLCMSGTTWRSGWVWTKTWVQLE